MRWNSIWRETVASSVCHKMLNGRYDCTYAWPLFHAKRCLISSHLPSFVHIFLNGNNGIFSPVDSPKDRILICSSESMNNTTSRMPLTTRPVWEMTPSTAVPTNWLPQIKTTNPTCLFKKNETITRNETKKWNQWETNGKPMGNQWETNGKPMGNQWEIQWETNGKPMGNQWEMKKSAPQS